MRHADTAYSPQTPASNIIEATQLQLAARLLGVALAALWTRDPADPMRKPAACIANLRARLGKALVEQRLANETSFPPCSALLTPFVVTFAAARLQRPKPILRGVRLVLAAVQALAKRRVNRDERFLFDVLRALLVAMALLATIAKTPAIDAEKLKRLRLLFIAVAAGSQNDALLGSVLNCRY